MGKKRAQQGRELKQPVAWRSSRIVAFLERYRRPILVCLMVTASIRIVATYAVFNHTSDEPAHIACGLEWLDKHVYRYESQHPPLTRIMAALGPYLDGARSTGQKNMFIEGNAILYGAAGSQYDRRLALARAGNLPFFWLACGMVF